jgi:fatty-acyl-CoA synthase
VTTAPEKVADVRDTTIAGILRHAAVQSPATCALVAGTAEPATRTRWTYAEAVADAEAIARVLADRHAPGERVAVIAPSLPEVYLLSFAVAMARLVLVPVNPALRTAEIEHILRRSSAVAVFTVAEHRGNDLTATLASLRSSLPDLRDVVGFEEWPALLTEGRSSDRALPAPDPDDVALLVFTSGTTGAPKGAMLTHRGMTNGARASGERFDLKTGDVYVSTIPLYHGGGQAVTFMTVQARATDVLLPQFDAKLLLDLLEAEHGTHTAGVPTMLRDLLDDPTLDDRDLSALRAISSGGSIVPAEMVRELDTRLGAKTTIIFGQTETGGYIAQTFPDDTPEDQATTLGRLFPHLEARVIDTTTGADVPTGEAGELLVRGCGVMAGYLDDPEQTAATIEPDGWLHTGDVVSMDERGYLRIVGRCKDVVISGGVNVFPAEIEAALATYPSVAQVAVLGLPDDRWGEMVTAVVLPAPGANPDPEALEQFARERLAPYKVPKRWVLVDELPMTASGKVQKFLLREQLTQ